MALFSFDITELENKISSATQRTQLNVPELKQVPFQLNKNKFVRVAFDMFQSKYDHSLWELREEAEGNFLIKRTDLDNEGLGVQTESKLGKAIQTEGAWSAWVEEGKPVRLLLYSVPVREFDSKDFNYTDKTASLFADSLLKTISSSENIAKKYVHSMDTSRKDMLKQACSTRLIEDDARAFYSWLS